MELKELRERLETIQNMDNIDDLKEQISLKDEIAKQIEYANDMEKDLTIELEETRDFSKREELAARIQRNRAEKDEKSMQLTQIESSIDETKKSRKTQKQEAKADFTTELQEKQAKNQAKIDKKKSQIEQLETARKEMLGTIEENKTFLKLKKPDSKVYQAVSEESAKCLEEARNRNKRVKRLTREISTLEKENKDIDTVLKEIELIGIEKKETENQEIKDQEDKMWEDYRKEQKEAEAKKDKEIDLAYAEKEQELSEHKQEEIEKNEEESKTDEQKTVENEVKPSRATTINVGQRPQTIPNAAQESVSSVKPNSVSKMKYSVKQIKFAIENNQPTYHVIVEDKDGNQVEDVSMAGFNEIETINQEKAEALYATKNICQAAKYYDVNIEKLLMEVDEKYSIASLRQYQQIMKEVELKGEQKNTALLDIDYDFSELYQKPENPENKAKLQALKKLAKADSNKKIASYEKAPNLLKVLWKKISQKLLPPLEESSTSLKPEMEETTPERMKADLEQLYDEPGFSMDEFTKNMPEEEANKYRDYRDSLKLRDQQKSGNTIQRKIGQNVVKIMKNSKEKVEKTDKKDEKEMEEEK